MGVAGEKDLNQVKYQDHSVILQGLRFLPRRYVGKARLAKFLLGDFLQSRDIHVFDRFNNNFVVPSLIEPIAFHLLIDGVYEPETLEFLLNHLCLGSSFVDVGANIGVFTVPVARQIGLEGQVLAIEPSHEIFRYLQENIRLNGISNVRLRECATFDADVSILPFYEAPPEHFGMGALAPQFSGLSEPVEGMSLDHLLEEERITHVDLLKVDVEGFESYVFRGARQLLQGNNPPLIIFEFCDWAERRASGIQVGEAQQVLQRWGFEIWRLSDFPKRKPPLRNVLTTGSEMLVVRRA